MPCKHHPACVQRAVPAADGTRITDTDPFLDKAVEVCAMFVGRPLSPDDFSTLDTCKKVLDAIEASFIREENRASRTEYPQGLDSAGCGPEDGRTLAQFRLCGNHARQLARGAVVASHYLWCYPSCPTPTPKLLWTVGLTGQHREPWKLAGLVALLRCWSFGVWNERDIDRAVVGFTGSTKSVPFEEKDDVWKTKALLATMSVLNDWNGECGGASTPMAGLLARYANADETFAEMVLVYGWVVRPDPSRRVLDPTATAHPF